MWFYIDEGGSSYSTIHHFIGVGIERQNLIVVVGRVAQPFHLVVEYEASASYSQDVNIFFMEMESCKIPTNLTSCPEDYHTCKNGLCIDPRAICDFTDDCGDNSDEDDCGGYIRCMTTK